MLGIYAVRVSFLISLHTATVLCAGVRVSSTPFEVLQNQKRGTLGGDFVELLMKQCFVSDKKRLDFDYA